MTKPKFTAREDDPITGETIFYDKHGNMDIFSRQTQLEMKLPYFNFREPSLIYNPEGVGRICFLSEKRESDKKGLKYD